MAVSEELWRLHKPTGAMLICRVMPTPDGYVLNVMLGDAEIVSEPHRTFQLARDRSEEIRRRFIAEGWTGAYRH